MHPQKIQLHLSNFQTVGLRENFLDCNFCENLTEKPSFLEDYMIPCAYLFNQRPNFQLLGRCYRETAFAKFRLLSVDKRCFLSWILFTLRLLPQTSSVIPFFVLSRISSDFATCSLILHNDRATIVRRRFIPFTSVALNTLARIFCVMFSEKWPFGKFFIFEATKFHLRKGKEVVFRLKFSSGFGFHMIPYFLQNFSPRRIF